MRLRWHCVCQSRGTMLLELQSFCANKYTSHQPSGKNCHFWSPIAYGTFPLGPQSVISKVLCKRKCSSFEVGKQWLGT